MTADPAHAARIRVFGNLAGNSLPGFGSLTEQD